MAGSGSDPIGGDEPPFSRGDDIRQRLLRRWRNHDFGRHTIYWSGIVLTGIFGYGIIVRVAEALGVG